MGFFDSLGRGFDRMVEQSYKQQDRVAREINNDKSISDETKQRVQEKIARRDEAYANVQAFREDVSETINILKGEE